MDAQELPAHQSAVRVRAFAPFVVREADVRPRLLPRYPRAEHRALPHFINFRPVAPATANPLSIQHDLSLRQSLVYPKCDLSLRTLVDASGTIRAQHH
jgi:hypothetical protein